MNCENKELFRNYYIVIPCCWPQRFSVRHWPKTKSREEKFSVFIFSLSPKSWSCRLFILLLSISHSLNHSPLLFFSSGGDLEGILSRVCWDTQNSIVSSFLPLLPSVFISGLSRPAYRDGPVLCSRYRPIDFGRERKYRGHDSPCMNLMIPVLSVPSFQWRGETDKPHAIFYHPHFRHVSNQIHRRG